jgi:putative peptidoglycan lipid II flippase
VSEEPSGIDTETGAAGRLVRSSAVVGVGTALSRITGLIRIGALAYAVGTTALADAYNLANTTPNIVYELILGGILSATLVPVFVDHNEHGDEDGTNAVVSITVIVLVALTAVAMLAAPWIFRFYTLRKSGPAADRLADVGVPLTLLFLPQMLFYGLTALGTALLNAKRSFFAPAFAPILNNVLVTAVLIALPRYAHHTVTLDEVRHDNGLLLLLGLGTTGGIVLMTLALWPAIVRARIHLRWHPDWRHPSVRKVAGLSGWTLGYAAANQAAVAIVLALAAKRDGDVSAYTYAFAFFQLPHGLLAVSIMTTFSPDLAAFASRDDLAGFRSRFSLGLRLLVLLVLPSSIGLAILAHTLVSALLERGRVSGVSANVTGDILIAFAVGLVGFSVYLYALRGFYAFKDTRTPFFLNLFENGLNIVIGLALVGRYGIVGLTAAFSAAYLIASVLAMAALRRRIHRLEGRRTAPALARKAVAAAVMGVVVWAVAQVVGDAHGRGAIVRTAASVAVGAVVYLAAAYALHVDEVKGALARVVKRGTAASP